MSRNRNKSGKYSYHKKGLIIGYALILSIIWHFLWGTIFKVDLKSSVELDDYTKTVFIGSILDEYAVYSAVKSSDLGHKLVNRHLLKEDMPNVNILPKKRLFKETKLQKTSINKNEASKLAEVVLLDRVTLQKTIFDKQEFDIEGPLEHRGVVFSPPKPKTPEWLKDKGYFKVKYKIFADEKGRVYFTDKIISSGYPEVDIITKKYLKKFRFSDLSTEENMKNQWGIISVKLGDIDDRS